MQFLADVFSIVEPEDVRWIFLSHDDVDHSGGKVRPSGRRHRLVCVLSRDHLVSKPCQRPHRRHRLRS
mgnify:CR=1 FL=1